MAKGFTTKTRNEVAALACKEYKKSIDNYIRAAMQKVCQTIVHYAIVRRRSLGHQFTGNLVNSICAGVYEKGSLVYSTFSYEELNKPPIRKEMCRGDYSVTPEGKIVGRIRTYHFNKDWEESESTYEPETKTDEWYGQQHAKWYIDNYLSSSNYFEVAVAYTADYAEFVEENFGTVGFFGTMRDFNNMLLDFQKHANKGVNWSSTQFGHHVVLKSVNVT